MKRNYVKEAAWNKKVYKIFSFKSRKDNGETDRIEKILNGRSFSEWVREKMAEEESRE